MSPKEIRRRIRELRRQMRQQGIKITSCFNGGHTVQSLAANQELFRLNTMLQRAEKEVRSW